MTPIDRAPTVRLLRRGAVALATTLRLAAAPLTVPDLEGRAVDVLPRDGARATVLVFAAVDCPISNRYVPELQRLHAAFSPRGAVFYLVYVDPRLDPEAAKRHGADFAIPFPALMDRDHRLVERTGVEVTPEAAVLGPGGDVLWRGRIDDRWADFGQRRAQARHHDLEDALVAILDGRAPPPASGRAVGCYIEPPPGASR